MLNKSEIQNWLVTHLAERLRIAPAAMDVHETFANYGLSSRDAVTLSGDLEELLDRRLSPTLAYEYSNIFLLAGYLAEPTQNKLQDSPSSTQANNSAEPIAIIGIGCRFPGAKNPEVFWELLKNGTDVISEIPTARWQKDAFYHPDAAVPGKAISYWGGFLDDIDQFDPFFFGISPMEAAYMDPQQRLLLELSYEALDDAGKTKAEISGTDTGVFIGISINEYSQLQFNDPSLITSHSGTGNALSIAANRISYFFDFHGPSMAIDTACSSSLAAVHLACKSIRSGECHLALAGGVNIILSPAHSIAFTKAGVLAPDGRCKAFDARANGYVRGEGGGVVVLKHLSTALADGDPIYALIQGSAINQDGRTNGLMAPSSESQEALLREAYRNAGIAPGTVQYIEAHGTGTLLGDAMEATAIGAVIGTKATNNTCTIGTVKSNIGHLEAAAGIAGLIKVALSIKHRMLPSSLHYQSANPHIPFDQLHIKVQNGLTPWPGSGRALAGVSSFGFGGTNVHVVVREAVTVEEVVKPVEHDNESEAHFHLLPLSANSFASLQSLAGSVRELLAADTPFSAKDICFAAGVRRSPYNYRLAAMGNSKQDLYNCLDAFLQGRQEHGLFVGRLEQPRKLVFVFAGQGGQWQGMTKTLLKKEPVFYNAIERISKAMQPYCPWSLLDVLEANGTSSQLDEIDVVQPAIFAVQVALSELWKSWGIIPNAAVGHSMGEVAAAHVAGILHLDDAVRVICLRSKLLKKVHGQGSMLVTELSPVQAAQWLKGYENDIAIAVINSPSTTVLSGDTEAIKKVMDALHRENLFCKPVNVDVASHSPQMEPIRTDLLAALDGLQPMAARIPIYSTVTGAPADGSIFDAAYWMDNLRKPVLFSDAITQLLDSGYNSFVEIGPHPVLLGSIQQTLPPGHQEVSLLPSLRREEPEREVMLGTLATLYTQGFYIEWNNLYASRGKYVPLPIMRWERLRYWLDAKPSPATKISHQAATYDKHSHPLLGKQMNLANVPATFVWQTEMDPAALPYLNDHRVEGEILFPAAAFMEMALQSAIETGMQFSHILSDFVFKEKMVLQDGIPLPVQTILAPDKENNHSLSIYSKNHAEETWKLHASAFFHKQPTEESAPVTAGAMPDKIRGQCTADFTSEAFYQSLQERGLAYGPAFRGVEQAWQKENEALGRVRLPENLFFDRDKYQIHPAVLDACLQVVAVTKSAAADYHLYLPTGCRQIRYFSKPGTVVWSHVTLLDEPMSDADIILADIRLGDENNKPVAEIKGFQLQRTNQRMRQILTPKDTWMYQLGWQVQKAPGATPDPLQEKRHWFIIADEEGVGDELAKQVESVGDSCYLLYYHNFIKKGEIPDDAALLTTLEQHLQAMPSPLYGIIHLWSLSIPLQSLDLENTSDHLQMAGCNSALLLVQALAKRLAGLPRLWLVTRGAQSVHSSEPVSVVQSALWGLGKVISFELPELRCVRVDLNPHGSSTDSVSQLFRQLSIDDTEDQIAYRTGVRYVHRLLPFRFSPATVAPNVAIRVDSTYLITGGLGALGLATAKWMVHQGARHIVLMGRSDPSAGALRIVEDMMHEGAAVIIAQADVSDAAQVEEVFEKIEQHMPPLKGVIHAAGVLDDGALLNLTISRMKTVMAPKVNGTWNLHKATLHMPLDFFVLFSSVVSVLGAPGQGNYAAASAYLDAMAYYRRQMGLPAISINWGPWAEVGLAAEATDRLHAKNASTQHLIKVIKVEDGLAILGQLLAEPTPQVTVLPFDLANLLELYPTAAGMPFFAEVGGSESHVARLYARPKLRQQYVAPRTPIERKLADLWRQTLHIDRVGVNDSFFELGGDSVLAAQILSLAQKAFGIRINPQDAFKAFTIERLSEMLEAALLKKIEEMSETEAQEQLSKMH